MKNNSIRVVYVAQRHDDFNGLELGLGAHWCDESRFNVSFNDSSPRVIRKANNEFFLFPRNMEKFQCFVGHREVRMTVYIFLSGEVLFLAQHSAFVNVNHLFQWFRKRVVIQ